MKTLLIPTPAPTIAARLVAALTTHFPGAHFSLEQGGLWARIEVDPPDFGPIVGFVDGFLAATQEKGD